MQKKTQEPEGDPQAIKENQHDSDKSTRSILPVYLLSECLTFCTKIYTELGVGSFHGKDLISKIHGVAYASIKQKFSSAQYYGLLELKHGVGYKLTSLFLKIHKPENDGEKLEGIIESLKTPEVYSKLLDEFNGHSLPSEQGLSARLLRTFGIKEYAATKAAEVFLDNIKNNSLLDSQGNLFVSAVKKGDPKSKQAEDQGRGAGQQDGNPPKFDAPLPGYIEIPVPLNSGKRAYIKIPEDYKPEDCERIAKFVEALK